MSKNDQWIIDIIKGKPNSLTSIAFNTGVTLERLQIINIIEDKCECDGTDDGYYYCHWHKLIDEIKEQTNV
jgi:hypothetical protein